MVTVAKKRMLTPKQLAAAKLLSDNISLSKPRPVKDILCEAGYSPSIAARGTAILKSKNFLALMEERGITDDKLIRCIKRGLAPKVSAIVMHRFLETSLKLKGHLKDTNGDGLGNLIDYINNLKDFNIEILIGIKQRLSTNPGPVNVTPSGS